MGGSWGSVYSTVEDGGTHVARHRRPDTCGALSIRQASRRNDGGAPSSVHVPLTDDWRDRLVGPPCPIEGPDL